MIEHKTFSTGDVKVDETGAVSVAFARLQVIDKDKDWTEPGAFPRKDVAMSAYGHASWEGALPVGRGRITEQGGWAVFDGKFFTDTTVGRDTYLTVKALGDLQEWSYGFRVLDAEKGQKDGHAVRILKSLDVFEVSPVLVGAGNDTHTRSIKSAGSALAYADDLAWVLGEVKRLTGRTRDRSEWRAKEGRLLSGTNRDALASLHGDLAEMEAELRELLAEMEAPKSGDSDDLDRKAAAVLARARSLGVKVD